MFKAARNFFRRITGKKDATILLVGLDNAGKTTIINSLRGLIDESVVPTVGMTRPVDLKLKKYDITCLDLGGHINFRSTWAKYYDQMHAVIFVIDSADLKRMDEMKEEFGKCSKNNGINNKPFLIFANKQDLPSALSEVELSEKLNLASLNTCSHNIIKCIAKASCNGDKIDPALQNGLLWIIDTLDKTYDEINKKVVEATKKAKEDAKKAANEREKRVKEFKKLSKEDQQKIIEKEKAEREAEVAIPKCVECKVNDATRKCEASNWKPVCDECYTRLTSVATPPTPPGKTTLPDPLSAPQLEKTDYVPSPLAPPPPPE